MIKELIEKKEKKVEYVELIYDLIFVYIIGRNNLLLHNFEGGFVQPAAFASYVISTLAVLQIWMLTTYYINMYGRNGARDHIFMFINMFLMYILGQGTRYDWQSYHTSYHIAWALILLNVAVQYLIELRNHKGDPVHTASIKRMMTVLFAESALAALAIPVYNMWGTTAVSWAAILLSITVIILSGGERRADAVDFEHLTERAMLYVVFTFGEMIIAIAGYFDGGFGFNDLYFALMAFLIVVGLFLGYEVIYDRIIDRAMSTDGLWYMMIHIFLIFSLSGITAALEFMREEEIDLMPKMIFLVASFVVYYVFLFITSGRYAKRRCHLKARFYLTIGCICAVFIALMLLLRDHMAVNIAISVVFVFAIYVILYVSAKKMNE